MTVFLLVSLILALIIITGIVMFLQTRKRAKEGKQVITNYRSLYNFGKVVVPLSIVIMIVSFVLQIPFYIGFPLFAVGLVYLIVALANKDKW